ncbi:sulfite oxidase-like oxidoreductase [Halolamina salifodinae]|uniref:DMSO/TMAO reductase YedYZ molybdopterin-dependent catalytic subunit n=1 Tax=Halolamina salifodinae TaxID=1202767 RepID=A0A8T4GW62_9EURY|nr:sulfite oxidase-like oxidoreductase [Halolamina salifodinae]MBP1987139.1 DMSO/TMAO reductase YedYZ molybdopterin-dependent catalytic subunit [Halolamina salifodinae]
MSTDVTDLHQEFGEERLPPGQRLTESFPVLSKGNTPNVDDGWTFSVTGAVDDEREFSAEEFRALAPETQIQDFHCVTGWSKFDCEFTGLPFPELADAVGVEDDATHVMFHAHDGYTTNLSLAECDRREVMFVWGFDGEALPADHGGPLRVVTPHKYAYKGAKWVKGVEFLTERELGYWEKRGYSDSANPWNEERYS